MNKNILWHLFVVTKYKKYFVPPYRSRVKPGRVAGVISRLCPVIMAVLPVRLRRRTLVPSGPRTAPPPPTRISSRQTKKQRNTTFVVRTLLTIRPVFSAVWEDLANLNFDCPSGVHRSIHHENWWIWDQKDAKNLVRWKRTISWAVLVSDAIMWAFCFSVESRGVNELEDQWSVDHKSIYLAVVADN